MFSSTSSSRDLNEEWFNLRDKFSAVSLKTIFDAFLPNMLIIDFLTISKSLKKSVGLMLKVSHASEITTSLVFSPNSESVSSNASAKIIVNLLGSSAYLCFEINSEVNIIK